MQISERSAIGEETIKCLLKKVNYSTKKTKGYNNTIQFILTDANPYWIKISDGKIEKVEKANKKDAELTVTCTSDVLRKILEKELSLALAMVTFKVTIDGSIFAIREFKQKNPLLNAAFIPTRTCKRSFLPISMPC